MKPHSSLIISFWIAALIVMGCKDKMPEVSDFQTAESCPETSSAPATGKSSTWQPWEWKGWETFPSLYFAANPEGFMDASQMAKIS